MAPTSRRTFLTALSVAPLTASPWTRGRRERAGRSDARAGTDTGPIRLIAHRGGIVDDAHPENSPSSVEAAIERGYWMLEVDIRRTRDGQAVLQHDATFQRFYGDPRAVTEMTWSDVEKLRATPGGARPMTFDELCARCAGRIRLMLDIKGTMPDEFLEGLIGSLRKHRMLETTYSLSGGRLPELAGGAVAEAADREALEAAIARGEAVSTRRYLFELGSVFDAEALRLCREHDVTAVAALNTFRYEPLGADRDKAAEADARRLLDLGVRCFQIDSVYERYFTR